MLLLSAGQLVVGARAQNLCCLLSPHCLLQKGGGKRGCLPPTLGVVLHALSTGAGDFIPFLSLALGCFLFLSCPGKNTRREIKAKRAKLAVTGAQRVIMIQNAKSTKWAKLGRQK